jgi:hypothetical protein
LDERFYNGCNSRRLDFCGSAICINWKRVSPWHLEMEEEEVWT